MSTDSPQPPNPERPARSPPPTELLLKIFSHSTPKTLLSISHANRHFRDIVHTHERFLSLSIAETFFTSTTVEDFPFARYSESGRPDLHWLLVLERKERVLAKLGEFVHRFSGGICDCDHPLEEWGHAQGLRKLYSLSDVCSVAPPGPPSPSFLPANPRLRLLSSFSQQSLFQLWNTAEILMIELDTAYMARFGHPPIGRSGLTQEPWCHIFQRGPEWVLQCLKGDMVDWTQDWVWSEVYEEVVQCCLRAEQAALDIALVP